MRRRRRADATQPPIVAALRAAGRSVEVLSDVGRGVPDLLVGNDGETYLLEVEVPKSTKGKSHRTLQVFWRERWLGRPVSIVTTPDEALAATRRTR